MIGTTRGAAGAGQALGRLHRETHPEGDSFLDRLRGRGLERFEKTGFPTPGDEEWRKTSVAAIARSTFRLPLDAPAAGAGLALPDYGGATLVFVNGRYAPALSKPGDLPEGVRVGSLAAALHDEGNAVEDHLARHASFEDHAFAALNTAFLEDGAFVLIPDGAAVPLPIHLIFVADPDASGIEDGALLMVSPRVLIVAGRSSEATVVESYLSRRPDARHFTNAVTEIVLARDAEIDHYKVQRESDEAYHVAVQQARLDRTARLTSHSISLGGALTRNESNVLLAVEGAQCTLNGLYVTTGRQHVDNHTAIDHAVPDCSSRELYKGVLDGRSRGVFNGKIVVRPRAARTDSKQANRNLLLSDEALVDSKPELQIHNNDVKCSHAAAIGQLDETAVFYLRSRGLGPEEARVLLIRAFVSDIIGRIRVAPLRRDLESGLLARLPGYPGTEEAAS